MSKRQREQLKEVTIVGQQETEMEASTDIKPVKAKIGFDQWWLQVQNTSKLRPELKAAVYKHFESRGYLANENFDEGLRDFGIKA